MPECPNEKCDYYKLNRDTVIWECVRGLNDCPHRPIPLTPKTNNVPDVEIDNQFKNMNKKLLSIMESCLCPLNKELLEMNTTEDNSDKPILHVGPNAMAAYCKRFGKGYADRVETEDFIFDLYKDLK